MQERFARRPSAILAPTHPLFERSSVEVFDADVLVALCDWTLFASFARSRRSAEVFRALNDFYLLAEDVVEAAGGVVVKFMGDAALVAFPAELADPGVLALLDLKARADAWFQERRMPNRLHVNAHFGPATLGPMGHHRRGDVIGDTVNITASMGAQTFGLSPEAFRRLTPEHRRLFQEARPGLYLAEPAR